MRALITRPLIDAAPLAQALEARGFDVIVEPLLDIMPLTVELPLDDVQGILATSANGVRALAANTTRRDLTLWAVGDATAREAERSGFTHIEIAGGDVTHLAELVARKADPKKGALLHVSGSHMAGDLAGLLGAHKFDVRRAVLYEARAAEALSPELVTLFGHGLVDFALFFSPRTAISFVTLASAAGLDDLSAVHAYALSVAVAGALEPLAWRAISIAGQPTQKAMLAAIDADLASGAAKD
ncbi:MAG TPA: uroporphyrinogen-III synthase [Magnetospirillaceae bacterium]|jgi:uroporphyrinogen-III synthase